MMYCYAGDGTYPCDSGLEALAGVCKHLCGSGSEKPCTPVPFPADCGAWKSKKEGCTEPFKKITIKDKWWCSKECMQTPGCDGVTWNPNKKNNCSLHKLGPQDQLVDGELTSEAWLLCKDCGVWEPNTVIVAQDIKTIHINSSHWCAHILVLCFALCSVLQELCQDSPATALPICRCKKKCSKHAECSAVTWGSKGKKCTLKRVKAGFKRQSSKAGLTSFVLCDGMFPVLVFSGHTVQNFNHNHGVELHQTIPLLLVM
jgi:hypothetical protein